MFNTQELMQIALVMSDFSEIPGDSAIYVEGEDIKKVLIGIDVGVAELVLADRLGYDAVIAHHPVGSKGFGEVLHRHVDFLRENGVPEDVAEKAVEDLINHWSWNFHRANNDHAPSVARLLGMPFLNIHQPLDELGRLRMLDALKKKELEIPEMTVGDAITALMQYEEFQKAETDIRVALGDPSKPLGKWVVAHAAGTNGGYNVAKAYYDHGIDTVIYIHIPNGDIPRLKAEVKGNLIITGHISSDRLGITPYIKELRSRGLEVDVFSGL